MIVDYEETADEHENDKEEAEKTIS